DQYEGPDEFVRLRICQLVEESGDRRCAPLSVEIGRNQVTVLHSEGGRFSECAERQPADDRRVQCCCETTGCKGGANGPNAAVDDSIRNGGHEGAIVPPSLRSVNACCEPISDEQPRQTDRWRAKDESNNKG